MRLQRPSRRQGLVQRSAHQTGIEPRAVRVTHDSPGSEIEHHREVQPHFAGPQIGHVSRPEMVRPAYGKIPAENIGRERTDVRAVGRQLEAPLGGASQPKRCHEAATRLRLTRHRPRVASSMAATAPVSHPVLWLSGRPLSVPVAHGFNLELLAERSSLPFHPDTSSLRISEWDRSIKSGRFRFNALRLLS